MPSEIQEASDAVAVHGQSGSGPAMSGQFSQYDETVSDPVAAAALTLIDDGTTV